MPAARSNKDRIMQISRWLAATFPTPYPTTVRCVKKIGVLPGTRDPIHRRLGDDGETYVRGQKIIIRIAVRKGIPRANLMDTLIHEWAHALMSKDDSNAIGRHDDMWGMLYAEIYHRFIDDAGSTASENY